MTDLSLRLLAQGYHAITRDRARRTTGDPDTYESRLLGRRAIVLRGPTGAELFYDPTVVTREGAVPPPLGWLLFGRDAMHSHDGTEHQRRKGLFLRLLDAGSVAPVSEAAMSYLARSARQWPSQERVDVFDELVRAYGTAVIGWAGIDVPEREAAAVSRELARIVDGFGGSPRPYARAWVGRRRTESWAKDLVGRTRSGRLRPAHGSVLAEIAAMPLPLASAAVELLNVLRPTVAVAWLGAAASAQLAARPELARQVADGSDPDAAVALAHEVRRVTPFAPALAGRARREVVHDGVTIRPEDRLVLDVWETDTHAKYWARPEEVDLGRFAGREPGPYEILPQGGGPKTGHRCPGEPLTVQLLAATIRTLAPLAPVSSRPPAPGRRIPPEPPSCRFEPAARPSPS